MTEVRTESNETTPTFEQVKQAHAAYLEAQITLAPYLLVEQCSDGQEDEHEAAVQESKGRITERVEQTYKELLEIVVRYLVGASEDRAFDNILARLLDDNTAKILRLNGMTEDPLLRHSALEKKLTMDVIEALRKGMNSFIVSFGAVKGSIGEAQATAQTIQTRIVKEVLGEE